MMVGIGTGRPRRIDRVTGILNIQDPTPLMVGMHTGACTCQYAYWNASMHTGTLLSFYGLENVLF